MLRQIATALLLIFLAVIGVNWPELPAGSRLADLIFIPVALVVLALPGAHWTWRKADLAVGLYLFGSVASLVFSPDPGAGRNELVRQLYLAAIYAVSATAVRQGFATTLGRGLAIGGALLSVIGIVFVVTQAIGGSSWPAIGDRMVLPYVGNVLRLRAFTTSQAMFSCLLAATIPFAIHWWRLASRREWLVLATLMIVAALLTLSHAIAGVAVAVLVMMWPALTRPAARALAISGTIVIVLAFNVAATIAIRSVSFGNSTVSDQSRHHYAVGDGRAQIGGATVDYSVMSYARLKQVAWRSFIDHPATGLGLDRFQAATKAAWMMGTLPAQYSQVDPHSTLAGRLAECGIIGGLTLLLLWIAWARLAREVLSTHLGRAAAAAFAGLLIAGINADIMNFRFLWVIAGLMRGLQDAKGIVTASGRVTSEGFETR
jgi:hypothetical protein